jgi:hypothetical protein
VFRTFRNVLSDRTSRCQVHVIEGDLICILAETLKDVCMALSEKTLDMVVREESKELVASHISIIPSSDRSFGQVPYTY